MLSGLPVTVMGKVPAGVDPRVLMVNCWLQVGLQLAPEGKDEVAPAGRPETASETLCVVPLESVAVTVVDPEPPGWTVMLPEFESV